MSLRLRVILIASVSLLVLWIGAAGWMMRGVQSNLDRTLDGRLAMSARMVSGLLERSAISPNAAPSQLTEAIRITGKEKIACEIRSLHGEVLARTTTGPHSAFESLPAGFSTLNFSGHDWRVYVYRANGYQIATADRMDQRTELIHDLFYAAGIPFLIALLGGLAALWVSLGHGLAPLKTLSQQLRNKHADDTTPIAVDGSPSELRPVLDAMNGLLRRLARALSNQRAFTDAAAHELRTPLTVIDTHLQVARLSEGDDIMISLEHAGQGVQRLRRTLDQMMVLARAEAPTDPADMCVSVQECVRQVLTQYPAFESQRLVLTTDALDTATVIPRSMLDTVIRNLVDNALRYTPKDTRIEVHIHGAATDPDCTITIADRGPGLSADQAHQIGQRFWRGDQGRKRKDGAGLGLSIVRAIIERFGGTFHLAPRSGGGMIARMTIPTHAETDQAPFPRPGL